ncbi:transposable element Tc3 transposase [Trichonephila clavipes]|nr:transposable element Tc3 transposase [Trichonephila clavipes]
MITNFIIPELNNHDVQELWFQQDGSTCHTARATIDLLKDTFGDRLISRFGPVNWPPRSCDLTPLDYFLWGYVKSLVYSDKPQTLDHLEDNIRRVIADIRPQMLEKVIENWTSRLDYIRASRGSLMPEIILKCVGTSGSERCHLHEDQAQTVLDTPVVEKTATSSHFQQDNARPHTARVSNDCLHTVTIIPCPARSPDVSPIEHIWYHLGRRVGHPTSLKELEARLQQIRNEMSEDIIQNLYASMPNRIASYIRSRKGSTGY